MLPKVLKVAINTKPSALSKISIILEIGRYTTADAILEMTVRRGGSECALKADVA
jgi:hypothetical protein